MANLPPVLAVDPNTPFSELVSRIKSMSRDATPNSTDVERRQLLEMAHNLKHFEGKSNAEREAMSEELIAAMTDFWKYRKGTFMGFQITQRLSGRKHRLGDMLEMHVNNIGDPFYDNNGFRVNCKVAERAILHYYGKLWAGPPSDTRSEIQPGTAHAFTPDEGDSSQQHINCTTGYITCMGSTEGNTYICRQARDYLKGKFLLPIYDVKSDPDAIAGGGSRNHRVVGSRILVARRQKKDDVPAVTLVTGLDVDGKSHQVSTLDPSKVSAAKAKLRSLVNRMEASASSCGFFDTVTAHIFNHADATETATATAAAHVEPLLSPASDGHTAVPCLLPPAYALRERGFCEPIILYSRAAHY